MDVEDCKYELELCSNSELSLFKLLNCCKTQTGSELLKSWILLPLNDILLINQRLDLVEFFGTNTELRINLFQSLQKLPKFLSTLQRLSPDSSTPNKRVKLSHCKRFYYFSMVYQEVTSLLKPNEYFSSLFSENKTNCMNLIELLEKSIDLDTKCLESEIRIKPDFDKQLQNINQEIENVKQEIEDLRISASNQLELSKELHLIESQTHGLLFEGLKNEVHDGLRRCTSHNFTIVSHLQRNVKITCNQLRNLVKRKTALTQEFLQAQIDLEIRIIEMVSEYYPFGKAALELLSTLDAILSIAHACFAVEGYCRPIFNTSGIIEMTACRHPCLESITPCTPNNVYLKRHEQNIALITGPNMGGKSTYLRQVALCVIMAHIGCLIPADFANICITDKVMARIGSGDNQICGVSTFMAEMKELSTILTKVTPNSLLIIDEIGRGTSSSEGYGIVWSITEHFSRIGCFTLIATHFSELCSIRLHNIRMFYTHFNHDEGSINMSYKIIPGSISFSFGLEIASLAGMPEETIKKSREIKSERELTFSLKSLDDKSILIFYDQL